jgi:hypothetical protein
MISALATALLVALVMGYPLHQQAKRAKRAEYILAVHDALAPIRAAKVATLERTAGMLQRDLDLAEHMERKAREDRDWERLMRAVVEAERDTYRTAFTSLLLNQARQEELRPDEERGTVVAFERRAGR